MYARVEKLKFPKFVKYKNTYMYLIWIMDVMIKNSSSDIRYRCLFKTLPGGLPKGKLSNEDLKGGLYPIMKFYPEFLAFFSVGKIYRYTENNGDSLINTFPSKMERERILDIEFRPEGMNTSEAGTVIPVELYNLNHKFYSIKRGAETSFTKEIKRQNVVITYYNDYEIITPSFAIAPIFYFTSTKIREKLLSEGFEFSDLYYEIGNDEQGIPFIRLKEKMPKFDIPFIYNFATHRYASQQAEDIGLRIIKEINKSHPPKTHVTVKLSFPFKRRVRAKIRGLVCDKCRKILVEEIQDFYPKDFFGFDKIVAEYSYVQGKKTEIFFVNHNSSKWVVYDRSPKNRRRHSKSIKVRHEIPKKEIEGFYSGVDVIFKNISEGEGKPFPTSKFVNKHEDIKQDQKLTFDNSPHYKDRSVKPAELIRTIKEVSAKAEEGRQFDLNDFKKMVDVLKEWNSVSIKTYESFELPVNKFHSNNKKAYYNDGKVRKFSIVNIAIDNKGKNIYASLVEVDQSGLEKGISTYVLVWPGDSVGHAKIIDELLLLYFKGNKFMVIRNALKKCCNASLIRKNHPEEKPGQNYAKWCDRLVKKIIREAESYSLDTGNK